MGFKNIVVLNDWEAIKEGLHNDALLGRPKTALFAVGNTSNK